jgi:N-methylhydantoinase B
MLAYQDLMDYSERLMRNAIRALPDGDHAAETTIDGFLDDEEAKRRDLKIKATLKVRGDEMTVDLTGTAPQVDDRPINMPLEGTVDCAIWLTLRSILLDSAVYGNVPQNMGLTRPTHIVAPKGTLANPNFPARVIARFCPGNALADTVMKALAQCVPGQVSAGTGNLRCVAFTGSMRAATGSRWKFSKEATAAEKASTAWTPSTRFTSTRETIRSRTSSRICRFASTDRRGRERDYGREPESPA